MSEKSHCPNGGATSAAGSIALNASRNATTSLKSSTKYGGARSATHTSVITRT